jgi:hypothetical protein
MQEARVFGQFSGQVATGRDTTKRRGDTKDRCARGRPKTEDRSDRYGDQDARDHGGLLDRWESATLTDAVSVQGKKKTDPRGLRGSAGSRKVPGSKIKKATTDVVAQDNLSASSSRTSSPSSLLASVDHLLLATH